jgi:hypothetical protein
MLAILFGCVSAISMSEQDPAVWTSILDLDTSLPKVTLMTPTIESRCKFFGENILRNLQRSTYTGELEMVVIDKGAKKCDVLANAKDHRLKYHFLDTNKPSKEFPMKTAQGEPIQDLTTGETRNILLSKASGQVMVAMDDDDVYGSGYVDFMVKFLAAHPRLKLINLDGYISMSVDEDGSQKFGSGQMGKRTGATFVFFRAPYIHHNCMYTNKTGSDEWALKDCIKQNFGPDGFMQVPFGQMTNKQAYIKTGWAFQTVLERFQNRLAAKALDFPVKKGDKVTKDLRHDVDKMVEITVEGKKKKITEKEQYMMRVAKALSIADLMLSESRPMSEGMSAVKNWCKSSGDWHDYNCMNIA